MMAEVFLEEQAKPDPDDAPEAEAEVTEDEYVAPPAEAQQ
jgi:hypothetical protein